MKIEVEYLPLDELTPYENNARVHGDYDIDAIAKSIEEFGFDDPIGVWGEDNVIVEGHGRLLAAERLGMDTVPVIHLDHLTDEQRRAYALAHNKTAELSGWDFGVRDAEIARIQDIDMTDFGLELNAVYSDDAMEKLFEDGEQQSKSKEKTYTCPHCGEVFSI